ncbi:MAG: ABC-F family ATP-binding cassette domain-containing protein [Candidatus Cloacimonetes bacterium]|nr:ABC-F family ATP-binding cassette domain-containing protein [Candidatus Cloacimonadota bacterium]
MSLIQAREVSFEFGGQSILRDVSCTLEHNSRIGLIGGNGSGKTTLIRLLLGKVNPSSGVVERSPRYQVAYLPQKAQPDQGLTLIDYVKTARPDLQELQHSIETLARQMDTDKSPQVEARLNADIQRFTTLGGYEWENELKHVLLSLDFPEIMWQMSITQMSGGEQTRLCLAFILLQKHDILILDEPTNHLDLAMIAWLEKYLVQQDRPYLLVSHDRHFLDATVSSIWHLQDSSLSITKGNYSSWKEADAIAQLSAERQYERQQKEIQETMDFVRRNIAGQKTKQAQSRLKHLERMQTVDAPRREAGIRMRIQSDSRSGNDLFILKDLRFGIGGKELARDVDLYAGYRDRICIIGPNGCGKTTLLRMLLGQHQPDEGELKVGASLNIAYYDQHHVDLQEGLSVMETLWQEVPDETRGYVLSWLARFGFRGDDVEKRVGVLSGGEKSRLYLCVLIHRRPNLFILDEPTNHLDIQMTDALLEALQEFDGSIIFVSHDRWFLSNLATKYWVFERKLDGRDLYTTIQNVEEDAEGAIERSFQIPEPQKAPVAPVERAKKRRINPMILSMKLTEIEERQAHIKSLQEQLEAIQMQLSDSDTYNDAALLQELHTSQSNLQEEIGAAQGEVDTMEHEYLELLCEEE